MSASADDQTAIFRPVWQEVHKALETPEAWLLWILVLMRPWVIGVDVSSIWEANVDSIEGHYQVFCVVDFLKCADDSRLLSYRPCERLVCDSIAKAHALLIDGWKVVLMDSGGIVAFVSKITITIAVSALLQYMGSGRFALTIPRAR